MMDALKPMHLNPMNLGEILDRTAQIYRRKFLLFAGIGAAPSVVVLGCFAAGALMIYAARNGGTTANVLSGLGILAVILLGLPLYVTACGFGYAALSLAAKKQFFDEAVTIRGAYREAWPRGWRYLGLFALESLIVVVAPFVVVFFGALGYGVFLSVIGGSESPATGFAVLGFLALLGVYVVWMLPRLCLAFPVCVAESAGVVQSLRRGWGLSVGTRGRILLLFLLGAVCGWMLTSLVTIPVLIAVSMVPGMNSPQHAQLMGSIVLFGMYGAGFAVQALVRPAYGIALMLFYYDQRIRKEGYDIEWMMQRAGLTAEAAQVSQPLPEAEILPEAQA